MKLKIISEIKHNYSLQKNNFRSISLYLLASLVPMLLNIFINPWIAINMNPTDYSIVGYYTSFNILFTPFITFSVSSFYIKKYFQVDENEREVIRNTVIQTLLYGSFVLTIISFSALYIYHKYFNSESSISFFPYAFLSLFSIPLTGIYSFQLIEYKMKKEARNFMYLALIYGIGSSIFTFIFIVLFKQGAFGKFSALLLVNLLFFLYLLYKHNEFFKYKLNWPTFKIMLIFCLPLTVAAMLEFFVSGIDKILLERIRDNIELGYYVVGFQMAGYLGFFSNSIDDTFQPDLYKNIIERNWPKFLKIVIFKLLLVSFFVIIFIALAPYIINILTAGRYVESTNYARIISLTTLTKSLYYAVSVFTIAMGHTYITLLNRILSSIASFYLISSFISLNGFMGAAWSLVLMYIVMALINIILLFSFNKLNFTNIKIND